MSEKAKPERKKVTCPHCGSHDFQTKQMRFGPADFDIRNPTQWLGTVMTAYVCAKCGHVDFFADHGR